eukprot:TRINITY_DN2328_c0_g1_i2.p2 TRINITY_DN2328_c0_g1~~TRINITY_DN2328_c0_g1_i2.p2  ORF type:complete len:108 (-),score=7.69 TRINITY_DN2328_c0_g1_i2:924-1247(-)
MESILSSPLFSTLLHCSPLFSTVLHCSPLFFHNYTAYDNAHSLILIHILITDDHDVLVFVLSALGYFVRFALITMIFTHFIIFLAFFSDRLFSVHSPPLLCIHCMCA